MTSLREFVSVEQHRAAERMTENLEILLEKEVSCSLWVGPGVRFGPKPQNKTASVWRSVRFRYDSLPCWGSVAPTVDITHLVLLLPDSCTTKICIFKIKNTYIVHICICDYTHPAHTLCTKHMPRTYHHGLFYLQQFCLIPPLFFFFLVFLHLSAKPPSLTRLFSPRMETQRPRSCCTATMWFVTTPMRHCALAKWTPMRMCYWPASTATSTAGDPTSPPR